MSDVRIVGMMSGSSLDGMDLATCVFSGTTPETLVWKLEQSATIPFDPGLKEHLRKATKLSSRALFELEVAFSKFCAQRINAFIQDDDNRPDYLSIHGHTIFHFPEDGYTFQIGKGSVFAAITGIPCIADVRSNDVASRGNGAPIAPISEIWLFPGYTYYINLGGIANFSCHDSEAVYAMDSCPCNQVLNHLVTEVGLEFDDQGQLARSGKVETTLLNECLALPYFQKQAPKSMDNTWVQESFLAHFHKSSASMQDKLATMVELVAIQLGKDMRKFENRKPDKTRKVLVTGGGAYNLFLLDRIKEHTRGDHLEFYIPDPSIIDFKEAILMALMGYLRINEIPNNIPSVTGAQKPSPGGAIYLP